MINRPNKDIIFFGDWKIAPTGIKISVGFIPAFVIRTEYEIEQFFSNIGLNAYNLPGTKGDFDIRMKLIDFVPEKSKKKFIEKLKYYEGLNNDK